MHLTAGNSIRDEENGKNISNSKHDNNDIGVIKKCNGQTFAEERAILIDTCHVRCAVVQIMSAFIYICKELNSKKNESSTISFIIFFLNLISVKICSLIQIVSRLFHSRRSVCCATLPLRSYTTLQEVELGMRKKDEL